MSNVDHLIAKLSPEHQAEMRKMVALAHPKAPSKIPEYIAGLIGIPLVLAAFVGFANLVSMLPLGWGLLVLGVLAVIFNAGGTR